ncbi:metallo-beta-lactamase family protein [Entamoeba histolytica HM-1:IMSS-B]|uniref:Metallo-beta-lactamase family protein n=6 Tax=Entamoeba histolytica TaxID=5759 RepID=C4M214_ENTH1|nr:metallo-beta-lactamase family protein [Entamoeba histolytica HM-1:IMSS]EMD43050.1 metallobeta-lactamase family protein [Entamoeba histolytica KU27]EMH74345.1 metallo-beta-lactamase family protein [Entamoeba histolytica HM-1:IMSS-B]EMS12454.1 metallo-beta-lactamase family protein [Entamoeba histolytica HM-3:IMSS]ENY60968.1 metallo-beta-lactamase family protein, putative [Entamoeba histolytica HM-1:IMSS-A]GAT95292.1 metallo-beta-lactamase family protein [Entamoeba histolytica]|eukprot:XP_655799.1 metallo-beta-lactamase family protein [Entamoeba histolytica HM-1:IMSS]
MTHLLIAGTSAARPINGRMTTSTLIYTNNGEDLYLVDCGDGITNVLTQFRVPLEKIRGVIITHSHSDHASGIAGFVHSVVFGTSVELIIAAPKGIQKLVDVVFEYSGDIVPKTVSYIDLSDDKITHFSIKNTSFTSVPIPHHGSIKGHGIICQTHYTNHQDTSIAITGDTNDSSLLAEYIVQQKIQLNMLLHECTFASDLHENALKWGHSNPQLVIQTLLKIKPNKCIIHHFSTRYSIEAINKMAIEIQESSHVPTLPVTDGLIVSL